MKLSRLALALTIVLATTGCASTVSLEPAAGSNDPKCADVIVRLPDSVGDFAKRQTDAQATAAWGAPAAVILRCGLPAVYASTLACVTTSGVDWLVDASNAPSYRFVTFGRNPATEVIIDSSKASGAQILDELAAAIKYIPSDRECQLPG